MKVLKLLFSTVAAVMLIAAIGLSGMGCDGSSVGEVDELNDSQQNGTLEDNSALDDDTLLDEEETEEVDGALQ